MLAVRRIDATHPPSPGRVSDWSFRHAEAVSAPGWSGGCDRGQSPPEPLASAAITADALATAVATSGTWSATLHDSANVASTGKPVSIAWQVTTPPVYLSVRNTGALPLTSQTYTLTRTGFTTSYTATACLDGHWNGGGNCTGETVTLDTTTTTTATSADLPLAPGASASIKVTATRSGTATVTLSASVARTQTRPAATTSS